MPAEPEAQSIHTEVQSGFQPDYIEIGQEYKGFKLDFSFTCLNPISRFHSKYSKIKR